MKYLFFYFFFLLFLPGHIICQSEDNIHSRKYYIRDSTIHLLDIDPLGNFYVADAQNLVSKYDTTGRLLFNVLNINLGRIHSIDAGNPFKILVFYRDHQTIILYDRTLSEMQRISLSDWKFQDVTAVCLSPDNAIWIFDGSKKVLLKVNDSGNPLISSDPFDLIRPPVSRPEKILDAGRFLVLQESRHPVIFFDDFGNYRNALEKINDHITVSGEKIILPSSAGYDLYDMAQREYLESPDRHSIPLLVQNDKTDSLYPMYEVKQFNLFGNKIFGRDGYGVFLVKTGK